MVHLVSAVSRKSKSATGKHRLWGEVGELHLAEGTEDKLQAIGVPTTDDMVWKWHVHVPNRQNFFLTAEVGKIAGEDIPERISGTTLFPGEYVVTVAFRKDFQDRWQWLVAEELDGGAEVLRPHLPIMFPMSRSI